MDARGRFSHDQLRFEPDFMRIRLVGVLDTFDEHLRGGPTHLVERLAYSSEAWIEVLSHDDVVEADDRDVAWTTETGVLDSANGADGGGVVEAKHRGEVACVREQLSHWLVAELWRPEILLEVDAKFRSNRNPELVRYAEDRLPAGFGIERVALSLHESDLAVAQFVEVLKSLSGSEVVIEQNVGDTGLLAVGGDAYNRQRDVYGQLRINEQEAIDAAAHKELLVLFPEIGTSQMTDREIKEPFLKKILLDPKHDASKVALAEFWDDDADGVGKSGA